MPENTDCSAPPKRCRMKRNEFEMSEKTDCSAPPKRCKKMQVTTKAVCIKVPTKKSKNARAVYESLDRDAAVQRNKWFKYKMGPMGTYVGRPKCDGGWYMVDAVKRGSMFANPFSLKDYQVGESLTMYSKLIHSRLKAKRVEDLIPCFPKKTQSLLEAQFVKQKGSRGRSVAHYQLKVFGEDFKNALLELRGKHLGCWCEDPSFCHANVLANFVESMGCTTGASGPDLSVTASASACESPNQDLTKLNTTC